MQTENISFNNLIVSVINCQDKYSYQITNDSLSFIFSNSDNLPKTAVLKLNLDSVIELNSNKIVFSIYNDIYSLESDNAIFELDEQCFVTIRFSKNVLVSFSPYSQNIKSLSFETNATFIDESTYMPEFSISCFDDSSFLYPRQIRQGITDMFVFKINKTEMENIFLEQIEQHKDKFIEILKLVFQNIHDFMYLNTNSQRMFSNWNEILLETDEKK